SVTNTPTSTTTNTLPPTLTFTLTPRPTNMPTGTSTDTPTYTPTVATPTACPPINLLGAISDSDLLLTGSIPDGAASTCALPKPTPTITDFTQHRYDDYRFTNTAGSDICVTVSFTVIC